jgi:predicted secreted hydrolase
MEWWYYTGHLLPEGGRAQEDDAWAHVQFTLFRTTLPGEGSGQVHFGHLAMTLPGQPFRYGEAIGRGTLGEAGAREDIYHVWIDDWRISRIGERHLLEAWDPLVGGIRLLLKPETDPLLHGDRGFSPKGPSDTEASYYYSLPLMEAEGLLLAPLGEDGAHPRATPARGSFWMDHEFGNQKLGAGLVGWDWWGLQLPDGGALMLYLIRRGDDTPIPQSEGTHLAADGTRTRLSLEDVQITSTGQWTSPASGAVYPHGWRIRVPGLALDLTLEPVREDQELRTEQSTRVTYYEGAVAVRQAGVKGRSWGYVELVGYAEGEIGAEGGEGH